MALTGRDPLTFQSPDWSQKLVVNSAALEQKTAGLPLNSSVSIEIEFVTHYGCNESVAINEVDEVDVRNDKDARWTWVRNTQSTATLSGPDDEDLIFPWCRFRFYRKS
jgi:hypothetical protein